MNAMHTGFYAMAETTLVYELRFAAEAISTQMYDSTQCHWILVQKKHANYQKDCTNMSFVQPTSTFDGKMELVLGSKSNGRIS